jgi:uncharacterized protein with GYD domain
MASYLFQVSYTPEAWGKLIKKPQDRAGLVSKAIADLGGKLHSIWYAFGDYDVIGIFEMPGNIEAAAFAAAAAAGGALRAVKTTPLLTAEEGAQALKKAASCGYKPPK